MPIKGAAMCCVSRKTTPQSLFSSQRLVDLSASWMVLFILNFFKLLTTSRFTNFMTFLLSDVLSKDPRNEFRRQTVLLKKGLLDNRKQTPYMPDFH